MIPIKLSVNELKALNQSLDDCEVIMQDLEAAVKAGVPNVQILVERLVNCQNRIAALKEQYGKGSK